MDPFKVVREFEAALCEYTGAPFAVAVNSCTMALLLAVAWHLRPGSKYQNEDPIEIPKIEIPKRTYCSVPMSIVHGGGWPVFSDEDWRGAYQLKPLPVWDCARRFTSGMYKGKVPVLAPPQINDGSLSIVDIPMDCSGQMLCVSFHHSKILGDSQGGAILHDDPEADEWLRRARFDGRTEGVAPKDDDIMLGWHVYMSPDVAARLLWKLSKLPLHNEDLPNDDYPDLSLMAVFK